ncbi:SHOCT domain-containing protein [Ilumatobacter sp.]|uniref:SHOCT domain-containing protein n=1 Tax=Ilumatobacter sp. TaxID=1967498 RepID=UPI003AF81080
MLAYDYPILGLFWTMLMIFLWVAWLMLLFHIIFDIFRSDDRGGWGKAGWMLLVLVVPLLGVLIYLIARGDSMTKRQIESAQAQQAQFDDYVRSVSSSSSGTADEIAKLGELKASGVITDEEFAAQKAKLLA